MDNKRNLVYSVDLADRGEKEISDRAMLYIKLHPRLRAFSSLVDKITFSDADLSNAGKKVKASVNVYIGRSSWFGNLTAKVKVDVSAMVSLDCSQHTPMGSPDPVEVSCLQLTTENVEVSSLKTSLGSEADSVIGLVLDLCLKVATIGQEQQVLHRLK